MDKLYGTRTFTAGAELQLPRKVPMRVEPKSYFGEFQVFPDSGFVPGPVHLNPPRLYFLNSFGKDVSVMDGHGCDVGRCIIRTGRVFQQR